jgi:hypothetical protein
MTMWTRHDLELALAATRSPPSLNGADLVRVDLSGLALAGADLAYAHLEEAMLTATSLRGAILFGAKATGACMRQVDLRDANLIAADLTYTDLRQARLDRADLTGTDLTGALVDAPDDLLRRGAIVRTFDSSETQIDAEAFGGPVRLRVGDVVRINLKYLPGTHRWAITEPASEILDAARPCQAPSQGDRPGQPHEAVSQDSPTSFRFRARQTGKGKLTFRLAPPGTDGGHRRVILDVEVLPRTSRSVD